MPSLPLKKIKWPRIYIAFVLYGFEDFVWHLNDTLYPLQIYGCYNIIDNWRVVDLGSEFCESAMLFLLVKIGKWRTINVNVPDPI